ncbi:MAG: alpha/beta hydrolase [Candidatus Shapirobacteria bacterium]|nr:alpha/beta hydrolase [Candidatus Shapirobacteria bacterium]MDD4410372.1 alpha/beta hydrolase [Candidatus Shapirobacteria bacterium]
MLKPTLILLHGWSQNPDYFNLIKPILEREYQVFSPIMPGFGEIKINYPYNLDKYADWLKTFIIKNKFDNPILLGHSFGGSVCVKFLSKFPNQKIKLILVDAAIVKDKYSIRKTIYYFLIHFFKPNINSSVMEKTFQNAVYCDLLKEASKLKNETLIIWGSRDLVTPVIFGKKIKKSINDSKIKIIPNSGHFPFVDDPMKFIFHLNKFLRQKQ